MLSRIIMSLVAAALSMAPAMASAQMQRTVESDGASYGPILACIGNYAVRIGEGEAARHMVIAPGGGEQLILITNSARRIALRSGMIVAEGRNVRTSDIALPSGVAAVRYDFERWEGYRAGIPGEAVWSSEPAHRQYQLPASDDHGPVIVSANIFEGRDARADRAVLSRIVPRSTAACATLDPPAAPGALPSAAVFTPQQVEGPTIFCSGQLGIALREGERVRIFWPFDDRIAPMWIFQDGQITVQLGGGPPISRPVPDGRFLDAGFVESAYPDGSGSAWNSRTGRYAFGDGSPLTIYISYRGASRAQIDAVMGRLSFFRAGRGCDVQAMPAS